MNDLLARLQNAWENFSARERLLLIAVATSFGALLLWGGVQSLVVAPAEAARLRAEDAERQLEIMRRLRRDYDKVASRLAGIEQRIQGSRQGEGLRTLLEKLAQRSVVKIDSMEERQAPENDGFQETKLEVSLKSVTLTQTIQYLHNIESEERLLSIKSLRLKNARGRSDGPQLLDVTFTVSAFDRI